MNIPFVLADPALDSLFLEQASEAGLKNLKGHRSVGGHARQHLQCHAKNRGQRINQFHEGLSGEERIMEAVKKAQVSSENSFRIQTLNNISPVGLRNLPVERYEIADRGCRARRHTGAFVQNA